jgi:hypothetical protein
VDEDGNAWDNGTCCGTAKRVMSHEIPGIQSVHCLWRYWDWKISKELLYCM